MTVEIDPNFTTHMESGTPTLSFILAHWKNEKSPTFEKVQQLKRTVACLA